MWLHPEFEHGRPRIAVLMTASASTDDETVFRETTDRFWILRLITEVRESGVYVRLTPFQRSFRRIPSDQIQEASATPYAASSYSGWHWGMRRTPSGNRVYRLQGGEGVEVEQTNGERWFIGSQRPTELASAITQIR